MGNKIVMLLCCAPPNPRDEFEPVRDVAPLTEEERQRLVQIIMRVDQRTKEIAGQRRILLAEIRAAVPLNVLPK